VRARLLLVVAVVFLLHEAVLNGLRLDGVRPDLPLGLALVAAIVAGPSIGALVGFLLGTGEDVFVNTPFGLSALVACVVCFVVGAIHQSIGASHRWSVPVFVFGGSIAAQTSWAVLGTVLGLPGLLHPHLLVVVLVVATVNAAVSLPFAVAMRWVVAGETLMSRASYGH
jgi:rod shape-determining protein MreD